MPETVPLRPKRVLAYLSRHKPYVLKRLQSENLALLVDECSMIPGRGSMVCVQKGMRGQIEGVYHMPGGDVLPHCCAHAGRCK